MKIDKIYTDFYQSVLNHAIKKCKEFKFDAFRELAEEFTQDAFLKMIESDFVEQDKTYAWLETVVDNIILDFSRKMRV